MERNCYIKQASNSQNLEILDPEISLQTWIFSVLSDRQASPRLLLPFTTLQKLPTSGSPALPSCTGEDSRLWKCQVINDRRELLEVPQTCCFRKGYHPFLASCWITVVNKHPLLGIHICETSFWHKVVSQPMANIARVFIIVVVVIQSLSCVQHFATSWTI